MSQTAQQTQDMSDLIYRLKARLALANFKREHGFENIDLRTLESSLYDHKIRANTTSPTSAAFTDTTTIALSPLHDRKRRKLLLNHRFYPTSPPSQYSPMKNSTSRSPGNIPLSETRSQTTTYGSNQRKLSATLSSDDEDAAHLLVLMHQSPTMSS